MNSDALKEWLKLSESTQRNIFGETANEIGLPAAVAEKDWWVIRTLELVFDTSIAPYTIFKGGTSLSKAWGLIDRFSEDVDLALDRTFLGFTQLDHEMTGSQVSKLRKRSFQFITESLFPEIIDKFQSAGFTAPKLQLGEIKNLDDDPLKIEIHYPALTDEVPYVLPQVIIEIGSRSMKEPYENRSLNSFVDLKYHDFPFAGDILTIPTVRPERTFLEKIFLLYEEHQQPVEKMIIKRKSRHLYDLERLMDTEFAENALKDRELYHAIVEHRRRLTQIRGLNYDNHTPDKINPVPPDVFMSEWENDYKTMQESMLNKSSLSFKELIGRIRLLKERINQM
jgi:predicted nucleotidyltransferase component of viral defense system